MRTPEEEVQVQCKGEEEVQGKEQCKEQGEVQVQVQVNECVFVPSSIDSMLWTDFLSLRNKLKAPNTKRALTAIINKLMKFQEQGYSPNDIISTSYENGWKGVFEPRKEFNQQKSFKQQDIQRTDDAIDAFLEARDNGFDLRNLTDEQFNDVEVIEQCN